MDRPYVIGVDGGGTKTDCVLLDRSGEVVDYLQWGPTSHEFLGGFDRAESEILEMISVLLSRNGIAPEKVAHAAFGIAGLDSSWQQQRMEEIISRTGLPSCTVMHDACLGIKAATTDGTGAAVINGTGCSLVGLDDKGQLLLYGGQSLVMDDIAGGYVLGRQAVRLVFEDLVLGGTPTLLSSKMLQKLESTPEDFMETLMQRVSEGELAVKDLAPLLFEAAREGDRPSADCLKSAGTKMGEYLTALLKRLNAKKDAPVEVVLIGSVFLHAADPVLQNAMAETVEKALGPGTVRWRLLRVRPVCGAAADALEAANGALEPAQGREQYLLTLNGALTEIQQKETGCGVQEKGI